ncbi:TPA: PTS transporter subunit EIIC [Enterococcus faecalis]|uniref:PTS transporter subunit EIIC n=1 Tax=Enterococcus TaxID=1350 RepID=UPI00032EC1E9|nr:PTS transporter subunit EIIC [Enterococcus faecalis]BDH64159.1 PTS lactose transporter subunit IIBC [Enterococcus sp. PLM3]EGO2751531.1 PTS transporter subunit EIIC [Enterococcus faecalis]EGO5111538.1 PTS transporter subunit EIIC [Enterococcus faecalis]EGO5248687.1 PTS transporter subunit EIIC [Enterococcus faecalis]EGO6074225.1 PTS transporter subunit EIIC [Enterococcus faecalis]
MKEKEMHSLFFKHKFVKVTPYLRRFGHRLSGMIMPNLSIFIAWSLLSLVAGYTTGNLRLALSEVETIMIRVVLPILIGFTGGKMFEEQRGGVVAAIATVGVIVSTDVPQLFGAMFIGPLAGYTFAKIEQILLPKVKEGYEMLTKNFLAGIVGGLLCCFGILVVAPAVESASFWLYQFSSWLIEANLLPLVHVFLEPLKVLFFNNAINHGLLTPLGLEGASQTGQSILFLLETNPGPGVGVLVAFLLFGPVGQRKTAGGATMIQLIGGIHEIYFPFVLMDPRLFLAVIAGGMSGTLVFQIFNGGLSAPASPGSLVAILANAPTEARLAVFSGIFVSFLCSFAIASLLLKRQRGIELVSMIKMKEEDQVETVTPNYQQILFVCDAGMGSSAMGASLLSRQLKAVNLEMPVTYQSVHQMKWQPKTLVVIQAELKQLAQKYVPEKDMVSVQNFLEIKSYYPQVLAKLTASSQEQSSLGLESTETNPTKQRQKLVFLYAENVRGSQTMGMELLRQQAAKQGVAIEVSKEPLETVFFTKETTYVVTRELAQAYHLDLTQQNLYVVTSFLNKKEYQEWLEGGADRCF